MNLLSGLSLRATLGLLFALLYPRLTLDSPALAVAFASGWVLFVAARLLVLAEPGALRHLQASPTGPLGHLGESIFVSLALAFVLLWVAGVELIVVPMGAAIVLVILTLVLYTTVLGWLTAHRSRQVGEVDTPRPRKRTIIRVGAFLAEQAVLLAALSITEGARRTAVSAPATILDLLSAPVLGLVLLGACYLPIARLSQAVSDRPLPIGEIVLVHAAALFVLALTGSLPFV